MSKIETGKRIASPQLASLIDTALAAGGEVAALLEDAVEAEPDCQCDLPAGHPEDLVESVDLPPDLAGATAVHSELIAVAFEHSLVQIRKLGQTTSPGAIFPILDGSLRALRGLLNNTLGPSRPRLLITAARYAEYFGWMKQEVGRKAEALAWTTRAVRLSQESGCTDMHAYALVRQALIRMYSGDWRGTVSLAVQAQADHRVPARILGLAALREGQGHALNRDYSQFRDAMSRATEHLHAANGESTDALYGSYTVADPVRIAEGWSLYHLGRPADGAAILAEEIVRVPSYAARSYGRYATRCALQYVVCGELDEGCALVEQLLPRIADVVSATILSDLNELSRQLVRRREHSRVKKLLPDLSASIQYQSSLIGATPGE